jgi:predicted Zn-dependent protease
MVHSPEDRIFRRRMTRRDCLWLAGGIGVTVVAPPVLSGCATNPVTGGKMFAGLSEEQEVALDRQQAPLQFSNDYGAVQDKALNGYVDGLVQRLGSTAHRPNMPYSARVLNANYINAYTFPGGSMAATRGIMLELESEDELAALFGHETGHVNARHAAQQQGKKIAANVAVGVATIATAMSDTPYAAPLVGLAGQVGASALLAKYSRDDEREADSLGLKYANASGYSPQGMVELMDMLKSQGHGKPSLMQTMFSTHPMSEERCATAVAESRSEYASTMSRPLKRERYMDNTASLRRLKPAIVELQQADAAMAGKSPQAAQQHIQSALKIAPNDYAANVMMGKLLLSGKRYAEADRYLSKAATVYPSEAQAQYLGGISKLATNQPEQALARFNAYDRAMPGNPQSLFFKGVAYEGMQNKQKAGENYARFLQTGANNDQAQYAYTRLRQWRMVR